MVAQNEMTACRGDLVRVGWNAGLAHIAGEDDRN
jgi:hypothetical protein